MIQRFAIDVIEAQQPVGDILRVGVNLQRTRDELLVRVLNEHTHLHTVAVIPKIVVRRAGEVVSRSILMDYPQDLPRMLDEVRGKLHSDHHIDKLAIRFRHIEHSPRDGAADDFSWRVPFERQRYYIDVVTSFDQCALEVCDVQLSAARNEWDL